MLVTCFQMRDEGAGAADAVHVRTGGAACQHGWVVGSSR